jgi:hypothetical protein
MATRNGWRQNTHHKITIETLQHNNTHCRSGFSLKNTPPPQSSFVQCHLALSPSSRAQRKVSPQKTKPTPHKLFRQPPKSTTLPIRKIRTKGINPCNAHFANYHPSAYNTATSTLWLSPMATP